MEDAAPRGGDTAVQRVIAQCIRRQVPISVSLAGMEAESPLAQSCRAYHAFVQELLLDMYARPAEYGLDAGAYEEHLAGRRENAAKRAQPARTQALRASTGHSADGYLMLLYRLARACAPVERALRVEADDYEQILLEYDRARAPKKKALAGEIPYEKRLAALERAGLRVLAGENGAEVFSDRHPEMFLAMRALAVAADGVRTFGVHNFLYCDFRQITEGRAPDWADVLRPLSAEKRAVAEAIHALAMELGLRWSVTTYWKINYHHKGRHVACVDTDSGDGKESFLVDRFRLRVDGSDRQEYLDAIAARGEAFQKYFLRHLNFCSMCSTSHVGGQRRVFGHLVRLCCCPTTSFRVSDPSMEDLPNIAEFMRLRLAQP